MTRDTQPRLAKLDALASLNVALVKGYSSSDQVLARYPAIAHQFVDDALSGLAAVADGRADAYVGVLGVNLHLARQHGLRNLKVNAGFDLLENGQRVAVRQDWAPLAAILDKAIQRIPHAEQMAMLDRWVPPLTSAPDPRPLSLTAAEQTWLDRRQTLRIGAEVPQPPFAFLDAQGQPDGLAVNTVTRLLQVTGSPLQWVAGDEADLRQLLREGKLDALVTGRA